jgi:hypothetical protein
MVIHVNNMNDSYIKIPLNIEFKIPALPNYIQDKEGKTWNVKDLSPEILKLVGDEWTRKLIIHSENLKNYKSDI